jgi:hypothetical protein
MAVDPKGFNGVIVNPAYQESIAPDDATTPTAPEDLASELAPEGAVEAAGEGSLLDSAMAAAGEAAGGAEKTPSFADKAKASWVKFDSKVTSAVTSLQKTGKDIAAGFAKAKSDLQKAAADLESKYNEGVAGIQSKIEGIKAPQLPGDGMISKFLNEKLNSAVDKLMQSTSETFGFLANAATTFVKGLADKVVSVFMSNVFIPEAVYLAGLKALRTVDPDYRSHNDYIRKQCIKHDFAKALKWLDNEIGIKYSNTDNFGLKEGEGASKFGAIHVVEYIMNELNAEMSEYSRALETVDPADKKLKTQCEDLVKKGRKNLHVLLKHMIIGSYTHLGGVGNAGANAKIGTFANITSTVTGTEPLTVSDVVQKYGLHPSALGEEDKEFGKGATITSGDLDKFVPFWKRPKANYTSTATVKADGTVVMSETSGTSGSFIGDTASLPNKPHLKVAQEPPQFIVPRNANIKQIYIYLASKDLFGEYVMSNKPLYERLKHPFYDDILAEADKAMAGFYDTGLGKDMVDAINKTNEAAYVYAVKMEPDIYDPAKTVFLKVQDMSTLPEPVGPPPVTQKPSNSNPPAKETPKKDQVGQIKTVPKTFSGTPSATVNGQTVYSDDYISWLEDILNTLIKYGLITAADFDIPYKGAKKINGVYTEDYLEYLNIILMFYFAHQLGPEGSTQTFVFGDTKVTLTLPKVIEKVYTYAGTIITEDGSYTEDYLAWVESVLVRNNNIFEGTKYDAKGNVSKEYVAWITAASAENDIVLGENTLTMVEDPEVTSVKNPAKGIPVVDWSKADIDDISFAKQMKMELLNLDHGYCIPLIIDFSNRDITTYLRKWTDTKGAKVDMKFVEDLLDINNQKLFNKARRDFVLVEDAQDTTISNEIELERKYLNELLSSASYCKIYFNDPNVTIRNERRATTEALLEKHPDIKSKYPSWKSCFTI